MQAWDLGIERVDNGFIVRWWEEEEAGEFTEHLQVFEAEVGEWGDHEALIHCLRFVTEYFGLQGCKHDEKRIQFDVLRINLAEESA